MRIGKYLSHAGYGTRKDVKNLIRKKLVTVNNCMINTDSINIDETKDVIKVDNEIVEYKEFYYLILNKPEGYVSATEDFKYPTVIDLIDEYREFNLFPVGRLDIDTTGLVLLTNNGKLAHYLTSPKSHVEKEYEVEVNYPLKNELISKFKEGVVLDDGYKCLPATLIIKDEYHANIIIKEGKYHQIKRMFQSFGYTVMSLNRIRIDFIKLSSLELGKYRELDEKEIEKLLNNNMR